MSKWFTREVLGVELSYDMWGQVAPGQEEAKAEITRRDVATRPAALAAALARAGNLTAAFLSAPERRVVPSVVPVAPPPEPPRVVPPPVVPPAPGKEAVAFLWEEEEEEEEDGTTWESW